MREREKEGREEKRRTERKFFREAGATPSFVNYTAQCGMQITRRDPIYDRDRIFTEPDVMAERDST